MSERPIGESDFQKMGVGETNLYALYSGMTMVMSVPGLIGAFVAFKKSEGVAAKVSSIAANGAGTMYLAWHALKYCTIIINANLSTARRPTGVNVPDQHVYKVKGGPADGSLVLMDDTSSLFGPFNRAQRGLQNFGEVMPAAVGDFLLAGYVFPTTSSILLFAFSALRIKGALDYTEDRMKRTSGNIASMFCQGAMGGLVLAVGLRSMYLQLKR